MLRLAWHYAKLHYTPAAVHSPIKTSRLTDLQKIYYISQEFGIVASLKVFKILQIGVWTQINRLQRHLNQLKYDFSSEEIQKRRQGVQEGREVGKLDNLSNQTGQAQLIADPPPTRSTTLSKTKRSRKKEKNDE